MKAEDFKIGFEFGYFDDDELRRIKVKVTNVEENWITLLDIDNTSDWEGTAWGEKLAEILDDDNHSYKL